MRNSEELERRCRCVITALEGGMRWRCRKLRTTDRPGLTRHSTPSTIIHVIADNLFRRNRGECTAHSGLVAGNLVNIHVRIKPLAPVSDGSKGNGRGGDTEGERNAARWTEGKTSCRRRVASVQLFSLCYVTSVVTGFSPRTRPEDPASFFAFVIHRVIH